MTENTQWEADGRINQKRRTRAAVVEATKDLLRQGKTPSVAEAADAARVSRATAYRYFPTQEYLLFEAALDSIATDIDHLLEALPVSGDPATQLDALVQALQRATVANEAAFRTLLRLSLEQPPTEQRSNELIGSRLRGGRRVRWIEEALAPLRGRLDEGNFQRLVAALSLCMGTEALVVLRDVCGLTASEAEAVARWTAQALLKVGLSEAKGTLPEQPSGSLP